MKYVWKLCICAFLTLLLVIAELTLGHFTHCLTLLAVTNQSLHNLFALISSAASRKVKNFRRFSITYGWYRLEIVGLFCSQVFLVSLCFATSVEALQTIFHSGHLDVMHKPVGVCIMGIVHFFIWVITFLLIGGNTYHHMSILRPSDEKKELMRNAWYFIRYVKKSYIYRDLASCFLLIIATAVTIACKSREKFVKYVDPCFSLATITVLLITHLSIVVQLGSIIMQTRPDNFDEEEFLEKFPAVQGIHEFHHWYLTPGRCVITCHVVFKDEEGFIDTFRGIQTFFKIKNLHVTIQPEFLKHSEELVDTCKLKCLLSTCEDRSCCITSYDQ